MIWLLQNYFNCILQHSPSGVPQFLLEFQPLAQPGRFLCERRNCYDRPVWKITPAWSGGTAKPWFDRILCSFLMLVQGQSGRILTGKAVFFALDLVIELWFWTEVVWSKIRTILKNDVKTIVYWANPWIYMTSFLNIHDLQFPTSLDIFWILICNFPTFPCFPTKLVPNISCRTKPGAQELRLPPVPTTASRMDWSCCPTELSRSDAPWSSASARSRHLKWLSVRWSCCFFFQVFLHDFFSQW